MAILNGTNTTPIAQDDDGLPADLAAQLAAPFPPELVEWRPQGKVSAGARCQVVAYLDARRVQERLDAVCGPLGWSFDWVPVATNDRGDVVCAKGTLTIGGVSKSDVGTASTFEPSKGAVSDALKRAAVQWGIGRYLYELPDVWITLGDDARPTAAGLASLRAALVRRFGGPALVRHQEGQASA
jgi:hypothetical protein